jgi:mycothione reductase
VTVAAPHEPVTCPSFQHPATLPDIGAGRQPGPCEGTNHATAWLSVDVSDTEQYDLIIVGSGSGNSIPDFLAEWRIAIVERDVFGGTCLNRGCIPSKMFVYPADVALQATSSAKLGIHTQFNGTDWAAIRDRIFGRIDPISAGGREYRLSGSPNVTLIEGTAAFVDPHTMEVDGRQISAPNILIAAGSRPVVPPVNGLAETGYHTSDTIMRLDELPSRLGIIGGGFIAVEMGHVFAALGSDVTVFNRSHTLLRGFDHDIAERFTEVFGERVDLRLGHVPTRVERTDDGIVVTTMEGSVVVDELLVATGRLPNSDLLAVDAAGIRCHRYGTIDVDDTMATNVPGIWAVGDVANDYQLKHLANAEAATAFWNIAHPDDVRHQSYKAVPSAVFSNPQVATVGLTEHQAREQGRAFRVGRRDFAGVAYGWAMIDETGFAKVLVDDESGLIIGAHVIGPQASVLLQPIVQAMEFDQPAADIAHKVFYIHPALTEVIENALLDAVD